MPWAPMQKTPLADLLQALVKLQLRLVELHTKQQLHRAVQQVRMHEAQIKKEQPNGLVERRSR